MQKEADYAVIQEKLRELTHVIQQCQEERNRSEHNLTNITKTHERIQQEQKLSPYYKSKLRGQYKTALQDAESEEELLRKALDIIFDIRAVRNERRIAAKNSGSVGRRSTSFSERPKEALRRGALMKMLQQNALTLPLFIGQEDEKPPPLCGAIPAEPNYVAKRLQQLLQDTNLSDRTPSQLLRHMQLMRRKTTNSLDGALFQEVFLQKLLSSVGLVVEASEQKDLALARGPDDDENWILAEVLHYSHGSAKYEVDDIDEEQKERHTLSRRRVVPLPLQRANPLTDPSALFAKGTLVMALFLLSQKATRPPLAVAQRYVICCKEMRKK
ncbi:hypothetical protein MRX96_048627 [Rhipicephalus microplus]